MAPSVQSTFGVVILAAGKSTRAGDSACRKVYREIAGETVISRVIRTFRTWDFNCPIVIVRHVDDAEFLAEALQSRDVNTYDTIGGGTRQSSALEGLRSLASLDAPPSHVLIHDAARPFISSTLLHSVREALISEPQVAVILAIPVSDTLKSVDKDGFIARTVPRGGLYRAQTPQAFPLAAAIDIHEQLAGVGIEYTDDASLFEQAGLPVRILHGQELNMKLTYPSDFEQAERMLLASCGPTAAALPDVRVGHGYDTHSLVPATEITLCGVTITHDSGLLGHSDADVGLHAITNALLGTVGADDIGSHFPPSDLKWEGASSDRFVRRARELVAEAGGILTHCDVTLICEAPKISPHREAMKVSVARMLRLDKTRVSLKAGTNEGVGFVGRKEGIVAFATATVVFPREFVSNPVVGNDDLNHVSGSLMHLN
ncbi:hypothetical protein BBP40_011958 [Aspergillus hancockii]|nr:hypothetical protein BBP40_011958 [Aspergillus hancockii]